MGYDCTLHLVDERAIRDDHVPRILGTRTKPLAFEKKPGVKKVLASMRSLLDGDPEDAARGLTEMAVLFSSATLPHLTVRGMAISLWRHAPKKVRSKSPFGLGASPEPLFAAIVKRHPALHGKFPTAFEENYMTGVFIPSARIGDAKPSGASRATFAADWSSVPAGPGAFVYLSNRLAFHAERGKTPRRVASKVRNVMRLSPGPSGSVLMLMGDDARAWQVAAIRNDRSVAGLRSSDFAKRGVRAVAFEWSEKAGALYVVTETAIVVVPRSKLGI